MIRVSPLDIPQDRVAPDSVLRGLAAIDPRLTLVHSRGPRWWLLRYSPEKIDHMQAAVMCGTWQQKIRLGQRVGREGFARLKQARFALLGFKTVDVFTVQGEPDGRIVEQVRKGLYQMQNIREQDFLAADERAQDEQRQRALADAASLDRAKDAHRYMTSLSFGAAAESVRSSTPQAPRSGFVRQSVTPTV